jgi:hypothetical protein
MCPPNTDVSFCHLAIHASIVGGGCRGAAPGIAQHPAGRPLIRNSQQLRLFFRRILTRFAHRKADRGVFSHSYAIDSMLLVMGKLFVLFQLWLTL